MQFNFRSYTRSRSDLDAFFVELEEKIVLYEQHIDTTVKFYNGEQEKNLKPIQEQFAKDSVEAEEKYRKAYEDWDGTEDEKRLIAQHISGEQDVIDHYEIAEDMVREHYAEMFDYFNKSSIVILYALLESQLKRLCGILKEINGSRIAVDDFEDRDYIKGSFRYLDLVIELPAAPLEPFETQIKHIQYVRNRIVHNAGEFPMKEDAMLNQVVSNSGGSLKLIDDPENEKRSLKIWDPAYIAGGYKLVRQLFNTLFWIIEEKLGHRVLKERIERLFIRHFGKIEASVVEISEIKKGRKIVFRITVPENDPGPAWVFNCCISVVQAKEYALEVINQIDGNDKINTYVSELEKKGHSPFYGFAYSIFRTEPSVKITMMFS